MNTTDPILVKLSGVELYPLGVNEIVGATLPFAIDVVLLGNPTLSEGKVV